MNLFTWLKALVVFMCFSTTLMAQVVNIPDPNFKAALVGNSQINTNGDGEIQTSEAQSYTGIINVPFLNIRDLTGVEAFTSVTRLYVNNNQLTSINVSANTKLVALRCNHNMLTSLDVQANTKLTDLRCYVNTIGSLDVSMLPALTILYAFQNQLTEIDLSHNIALAELKIDYNLLTTLDLNTNSALTHLDVKHNRLTELNVRNGNNTNVTYFNAIRNVNLLCVEVDDPAYSEANWTQVEWGTQFSTDCGQASSEIVNIPDANFKAVLLANEQINVNADDEIQVLEASGYFGSVYAASKNISDLTGIEAFPNLTELYVQNNSLTTINVTQNAELRLLRINDNAITSIDLSHNPKLISLNASKTSLTSLDLSANINLERLVCFYGNLTTLDLTANNKLNHVQVNRNKLSELTLGASASLQNLHAFDNQLTSIDLSQSTGLMALELQRNKLTSLNLANNSALRYVHVTDNMINELDLNGKPNLHTVWASNNRLTVLDLSRNPNLTSVQVDRNALTGLNVKNGNNTRLTNFNATSNPNLTCIQVDDPAWSETHWTQVDSQTEFSTDCGFPSEDVVYIPDANFRARLIELGVDTNGDQKIQYTEAHAFTDEMMLVGAGIKDATGVEAFTAVTRMIWEHNEITSLNVTGCTSLKSLSCGLNPLNSLRVNPQLEVLECYNTNLTDLTLQNNNSLRYIDFSVTNLRSFNADEYPFASKLTFFAGSSDELISLNLAGAVNLEFFGLGDAVLLTSIDLSSNSHLQQLRMSDNLNLEFLNIKNGNNANITEFSLSNHPKLTCIEVDDVAYAEENFEVQSHTRFSEDCDGSEAVVNIPDQNFKNAVVSNPQINTNGDGEIQVSEAEGFAGFLNLFGKNISDLTGIEAFINITGLDVSENSLTKLFLENHDQLEVLYCRNNQINMFSIYMCDGLKLVDAQGNQMANLFIPQSLEVLNASQNLIEFVPIGAAPNLMDVNLSNNKLTSVDLKDNLEMKVLNVENNLLTWLNIPLAHTGGLTELEARNNDLTCIQVDDPAYAEAQWGDDVDDEATFSTHCEGDPDIVYIPDPKLKAILVANVDGANDEGVKDGEVQRDEALQLYGGLDLSNQDIGDMTGIQAFSNIEVLDCSNNHISFLTQLPQLTDLMCENNQITEITADVTNLYYLLVSNNKLTSLPTMRNILHLEADHNELTSLEGLPVGQPIEVIRVGFNNIESVNLADFPYVRELYLNDNSLTSLDASMATNLGELDCGNNQLSMLNIKNGQNDNLAMGYFNAKGNPDLTCIEVDDPAQAEASWRDNVDPQVEFKQNCVIEDTDIVYIPDPNLKALLLLEADGSDQKYPDNEPDGEVQYFEAAEVQGSELQGSGKGIRDVTGLKYFAFEVVTLSNNEITVMSELSSQVLGLDCSNNQITEITAELPQLQYLKAANNKLTSLPDMPSMFEGFDVSHNELTSINIPSGRHAREINCSFNRITSLSIQSSVESLIANDNLIESLDVSEVVYLSSLDCRNNQLKQLKVRNVDNGSGFWLGVLEATGNPELLCIEVDDVATAEANWRDNVDPQATFSTDCSAGSSLRIAVSPNPTMGKLSIQSSEAIDEVQIFDGMSGGLISREQGNELDVSYLRNGLYFLKVRSGEKETTTRIVKE